jgi:anti-sigma regulatory factor (Ser/Thr protein kinase)
LSYCISSQIDARLDHVWLAREALIGLLRHLHVDESETYLLGVAFSEVLNNAIEHGYRLAAGKHLEFSITLDGMQLGIIVQDDADPIPVNEVNALLGGTDALDLPPSEWSERGYGLQILAKVVDSVRIERVDGRNVVSLTKSLSAAELPESIQN